MLLMVARPTWRAVTAIVPTPVWAAAFGLATAWFGWLTVDAARAGFRVLEVEVDLEHRATGRTWRGFMHRFRQLRAFVAVWAARRRSPPAV